MTESSDAHNLEIPTRACTSYSPKWERFNLQSKVDSNTSTLSSPFGANTHQNHPYTRQYNHVYSRRLETLRERCIQNSNSNTNVNVDENPNLVPRIIELKEGILSTVVGTLVKDTPGRPVVDTDYHSSALQHDSIDNIDQEPFTLQPLRTYANEMKDVLILEDESGRVELLSQKGKDTLHSYKVVTGMVVAVTGVVEANTGAVIVNHIHFPTLPLQKNIAHENKKNSTSAPYVMLVSGLHCGGVGSSSNDNESSLALRRSMLSDYISGHIENETNDNDDAVRISRLIIAGGGCTRPTNRGTEDIPSFTKKNNSTNKNESNPLVQSIASSIQELDLFIAEICSSGIPTDLVPGLHDPTNSNFPQQPLHSCILPYASSFEEGLFYRTTNPYEAEIDNITFLGSDGANITDVRRFTHVSSSDSGNNNDSDAENNENVKGEKSINANNNIAMISSLQALRQTLLCSHIAPTAPDSLHCFPFYDNDPFVIEECPHVYFAGNCPKFETKLIEENDKKLKCRLICVPSFAETGQAILVNLNNLDCECITFTDLSVDDTEFMEE